MTVLRQLFSQPSFVSCDGYSVKNNYQVIINEDGGQDIKNSTLLITDVYDFESSSNPQIVVGRGGAAWRDLVIDNKVSQGNWSVGRGPSKFSNIIVVPILIEVYAEKDIEAENLAWMTTFFIQQFRKEIRDKSSFEHISSFRINSPQPVEMSDKVKTFKIDCDCTVEIGISWLKSSTINIETILQNPCPLSGEFNKFVDASDVRISAKPKINITE